MFKANWVPRPQTNKTLDFLLDYWKDPETWYNTVVPFFWYFNFEGIDKEDAQEAVEYLKKLGFSAGIVKGHHLFVEYEAGADVQAVGLEFYKYPERLEKAAYKYVEYCAQSALVDDEEMWRLALGKIPCLEYDVLMGILWEYIRQTAKKSKKKSWFERGR